VSDDGRGFSADEQAGEAHFGLRLLQDLAAEAGGSLDIESKPGQGTTVRVEVPL
jgi:signal transduction histidine kinase